MQGETILVEDVIRDTMTALERQGYNKNGSRKYNTVYRGLARFAHRSFGGEYTYEVGEAFIQSLRERIPPLSKEFFRTYAVAVEHANHVMEGDDAWYPQKKPLECGVSAYTKEVAMYEEYLGNSGKTKSDVRSRMHVVGRFLSYVDNAGITKPSEITAQNIYGAFQAASDKGGFRKAVGAFLRYAHRHMLTAHDLSVLVPSVSRHIPVPTVYTPDEVEKIIAASSKSKVCGRRNRAIVLLAARLGLRSCDIANLRFGNIVYERQTLELVQVKTGVPIVLPLLPEICDALNDYIDNERQKSHNDQVFLRGAPPLDEAIQGHTIYVLVSRIIGTSGIDPNGRKRGAHALRSSLATALLNEGNDHYAIQEALGQRHPNAVKSYVKTDVENLRSCALPVPPPSGGFAAATETGVVA
ncbi:MAG: tyrosine-type recombinase/integrase [Defluviitaleaceae bacterium]|nr:tyrosine-type recombinase/integrase [Defluviitaleaceae bacterium]